MAQDSKRGSELVEVIKSDDVTDLFKEYGEIAIDSALESGTLESIPLRGLRANGTKTYAKEITNCYN